MKREERKKEKKKGADTQKLREMRRRKEISLKPRRLNAWLYDDVAIVRDRQRPPLHERTDPQPERDPNQQDVLQLLWSQKERKERKKGEEGPACGGHKDLKAGTRKWKWNVKMERKMWDGEEAIAGMRFIQITIFCLI